MAVGGRFAEDCMLRIRDERSSRMVPRCGPAFASVRGLLFGCVAPTPSDRYSRRQVRPGQSLVTRPTRRPTHTEGTMDRRRIIVIVLLFISAVSLPISAQQAHVADQATLDQAVADHVQQTADDRQAILRALENEQVRKLAGG